MNIIFTLKIVVLRFGQPSSLAAQPLLVTATHLASLTAFLTFCFVRWLLPGLKITASQ